MSFSFKVFPNLITSVSPANYMKPIPSLTNLINSSVMSTLSCPNYGNRNIAKTKQSSCLERRSLCWASFKPLTKILGTST
jgi:hypothetical protein